MSEDFLVNASTDGLRPLGTAPQRSYELISGTVAARLTPAHAALFAEPISSEHGDRYDWYAPVTGKARPLAGLDPDQRAAVLAERDRLAADIRDLAASLSASGSADDQRLGEALENALHVPGDDSVWAIAVSPDRLQPVLVNWAWVPDRQEAVRGALSGADTRSRRPAPVPGSAASAPAAPAPAATAAAAPVAVAAKDSASGLWWLVGLGWLILAAMLATILWLAVGACALRLPGLPGFCPVPPAAASDAERSRLVLENRILQLEGQLGIADRACQPVPVALPPPPPPEPAPSEADARMNEAGARLGDLTFTLIWDGPDDLDLHVTCPAGDTVFYREPRACGGALDVDSNADGVVPRPIENIYFDNPGGGTWEVAVDYFTSRTGGAPRSFELQVRDRDHVESLTGTVSPRQRTWHTTYRTQGQ